MVLTNFEPFGRPALVRFLDDDRPIVWSNERPGCALQLTLWQLLADDLPSVLALPSLEPREVRQLCELEDLLPTGCWQLEPLPAAAPVPGIMCSCELAPSAPPESDGAAAMARTAAWVDRTLSPSGLRFCPYTASADVSASGLEAFGVKCACTAPMQKLVCGKQTSSF